MDLPVHLPAPDSAHGELIVVHGPSAGAARPITLASTLVGSGTACDIRIPAADVSPLHCLLYREGHGVRLRDLASATVVADSPVTDILLADGDVIRLGSVVLRWACATPPTAENVRVDAVIADADRDALRVQAAAVAAQQAALDEDEARLDQERTALVKQEEQLAAHLDDRQAELDAAKEEQAARLADLEAEEAEVKAAVAKERAELEKAKADAAAVVADAARRRDKARELQRKLVRRHRRHWQAKQDEFDRDEADLRKELQAAKAERAAVKAFHERAQTELEVRRREQAEAAAQFALDQQKLYEAVAAEHAERSRLEAGLRVAAAEVESSRQAFAMEEKSLAERCDRLRREADGLDERVRNRREALAGMASSHAAAAVELSPDVIAPTARFVPDEPAWPEDVRRMSDLLADNRAHLVEQWARFLKVQEAWQADRDATLADLEGAAELLTRRERELAAAESGLAAGRSGLEAARGELAVARSALDGRVALHRLQEAAWAASRAALLEEIADREKALERRQELLTAAEYRIEKECNEERAALAESRKSCDEVRRSFSDLWRECETLRDTLAKQERALSARALALDRVREEVVAAAGNAAKVETRYQRLETRESANLEADAKAVTVERERLIAERKQLDEEAKRLRALETRVEAKLEDLVRKQTVWHRQEAARGDDAVRAEQRLQRLEARKGVDERLIRGLRDEIERLARSLMDGDEPVAKAA